MRENMEKELIRGWQQLIQYRKWHHFFTGTFKNPTSIQGSIAAFKEQFVRRLCWRAGQGISYFCVPEVFADGQSYHIHAILYGTADLRIEQISQAWKCGFSRTTVYDPTREAVRYLVKDESTFQDSWTMSKHLPPRLDESTTTIQIVG
jgi:hypothetical protein